MLRSPALCLLLFIPAALAQSPVPSQPALGQLDPTRAITSPVLFSSFHQPLPEQYIWTGDKPGDTPQQKDAPRFFRVHVRIDAVPEAATLYLAGPRVATVWINGSQAARFDADPLSRLDVHVFHADVAHLLQAGDNVIAVAGDHGGELVAKLVPAATGVNAAALIVSGPNWKATLTAPSGWQAPAFDDSAWSAADAQGSIEGNIDFFQWNSDAGLYDWPGYEGASPFLAHTYLLAAKADEIYPANGSFDNVGALTASPENPGHQFTVHRAADSPDFVPGVTLDFGREVSGRLQVVSDTDAPVTVSIAYGESLGELHNEPYLGVDILHLPPRGAGVGPKSAFRYARIRFLSGPDTITFRQIRLEDIYYPVHYLGSFDSSDPLLNRIWETGVYTSHLCMQDDIWDAPKRDRGRWMGDTDVSGRVIDAVFADHFLIEDTLTRLIGPAPITKPVNGIPGYSSYWFTELADYLRHEGRKEYVASLHDRLLQLLAFMDQDFDAQNLFINHTKDWPYVDWAPGLSIDSPETHKATAIEYVRAYRDAAWLLDQIGDTQNAAHWRQRADAIAQASQQSTFADGSFGPRWQTNSMAVLAGVATPAQYASIWSGVLDNVGKPTYRPDVVSPYYGSYVLDAMAEMNHRDAALAWIREYWGGMIAEGATSFWEAYDPSWPKDDPHVDLQADDTAGYQTSLAHGWSSGPSYWLMEQVLGIQPTGAGFAQTTIRPDLIDLQWARGAEPTPHGLLKVGLSHTHDEHSLHVTIDLPSGIDATVLYPVAPGAGPITVNGKPQTGTPAENGARVALKISEGGHYEIHAE
ncbi:MAG TPA: alpha-L-rhamnosidase C-terminal domain-containing protein [Acidobacteriaceae bacterium]